MKRLSTSSRVHCYAWMITLAGVIICYAVAMALNYLHSHKHRARCLRANNFLTKTLSNSRRTVLDNSP